MNEEKSVEPVGFSPTIETTTPETKPTPKPPQDKKPKAAKAAKSGSKKSPKATAKPKAVKTAKPKKASKLTKKFSSSKYPFHPKCPFREGSGYSLAFSILAAHKGGMIRADLVKEYSKASRKPLKNAAMDVAVVLSPKSEKPTSDRHTSAREGYGVIKADGGFVQLVLP